MKLIFNREKNFSLIPTILRNSFHLLTENNGVREKGINIAIHKKQGFLMHDTAFPKLMLSLLKIITNMRTDMNNLQYFIIFLFI